MPTTPAQLLAAVGLAATLAALITGPVIHRLTLVREHKDPVITPFERVYQRAQRMADEQP